MRTIVPDTRLVALHEPPRTTLMQRTPKTGLPKAASERPFQRPRRRRFQVENVFVDQTGEHLAHRIRAA